MLARLFALGGIALTSLSASTSTAAMVEYLPRVRQVLNEDLTTVDPALIISNGLLQARESPYFLEVEVRLRVSNLGDAKGFSGSSFDIQINGDGKPAWQEFLAPAWNPASSFDCNGPAPGGADDTWGVNADDGIASNDLQEIKLLLSEKTFGPSCTLEQRLNIGQSATGDVIGEMYIELPGTAGAQTSIASATAYDVYLYGADGEPANFGLIGLGASTGEYRVVPEVASGWLLTLGCALLPILRKRLRAV